MKKNFVMLLVSVMLCCLLGCVSANKHKCCQNEKEIIIGNSGMAICIPDENIEIKIDDVRLADGLIAAYRYSGDEGTELLMYQWENESFEWFAGWVKENFKNVSEPIRNSWIIDGKTVDYIVLAYSDGDLFCCEYMFHSNGLTYNVMFRNKYDIQIEAAGIFDTIHFVQ